MPTESPFARAAIRDGVITLHPWSPRLIRGGPRSATLDGLSAALADLFCTGESDLIVTPITPGQLDAAAAAALAAWAGTVGYRRLWLPGQIIALDDRPAVIGCAGVCCPTCSARWRDAQLEFWEHVREQGAFPRRCMACGGRLPEWALVDDMPPMSVITAPVPTGRQTLPGSESRTEPHDSLRDGISLDGAARKRLPRSVAPRRTGLPDGSWVLRAIADARRYRRACHPPVSSSRAGWPRHPSARRAVARVTEAISGARAKVARTNIDRRLTTLYERSTFRSDVGE